MKVLNTEDLTHVIVGDLLATMVNSIEEQRTNSLFQLPKRSLTKFHSWKIPKINLSDYVQRINKYVHCSSSCYILALIYIDRAVQRNSKFFLTKYNVHR